MMPGDHIHMSRPSPRQGQDAAPRPQCSTAAHRWIISKGKEDAGLAVSILSCKLLDQIYLDHKFFFVPSNLGSEIPNKFGLSVSL